MVRSVDVEIEYLDASGDGVGRSGSRRITVPFTIPGERVRVALVDQHGARERRRAAR